MGVGPLGLSHLSCGHEELFHKLPEYFYPLGPSTPVLAQKSVFFIQSNDFFRCLSRTLPQAFALYLDQPFVANSRIAAIGVCVCRWFITLDHSWNWESVRSTVWLARPPKTLRPFAARKPESPFRLSLCRVRQKFTRKFARTGNRPTLFPSVFPSISKKRFAPPPTHFPCTAQR